MPPSAEPSRSSSPVLFSAPGLSVVALLLFVLFASLVAAALFPLQLLDPAWQLRLAGTLINHAAFPLLPRDSGGGPAGRATSCWKAPGETPILFP
jgi:hypothetical protein